MAKKVDSRDASDPNASPFMLHIKAAVAEEERRLISQRTRDALAAAKERGVQLGNQKQADANKAAAATRDAQLRPILEKMSDLTYREIAQRLTDRGIKTPRGGDLWNATTVMRVLKRLDMAGK